jgi:hypothetical protein
MEDAFGKEGFEGSLASIVRLGDRGRKGGEGIWRWGNQKMGMIGLVRIGKNPSCLSYIVYERTPGRSSDLRKQQD